MVLRLSSIGLTAVGRVTIAIGLLVRATEKPMPPIVVPTDRGHVQLEWYTGHIGRGQRARLREARLPAEPVNRNETLVARN